jgi:Aldo/keto reductase family
LGGKVREISTIQQLLDFNRQCDCHNCLTFLDHLEPCLAFSNAFGVFLLPFMGKFLDAAASSLRATPMQVALAWLLQRSPNILLIPGTSSVKHLRENLNAAHSFRNDC